MPAISLTLPEDAEAALELLKEQSKTNPALVFKKSPICPVSHAAESEWRAFLANLDGALELKVAEIDVIEQRPLARGLTAALGIRHESPQALLFRDGELSWDDSHGSLTEEAFREQLGL